MELNQVRHFITLCRTLNFTRAAEHCRITQPAFTRSIQRLEEEFDGTLILRERNLTQLTEFGRAMRPHLEAMLDAADAAEALAAARNSRFPATLKIGIGPGIGTTCIAGALKEITLKLPDLSMHFEEAGPAAIFELMLTDMLDCALVPDNCDLPERLNRWPLYTDRAVVVLPPNHRLLAQEFVTGRDIIDEHILVGELCGGFAHRFATITSYSPRLQRCNGNISQILDLVCVGLGIALVSDRLSFAPPLQTRRFEEPEMTRRVLLAVVAGRPLNPAAVSLVKLCRSQAMPN